MKAARNGGLFFYYLIFNNMPMGQYSSFADCLRKNKNKRSPEKYCGHIYWATEGRNKFKRKAKKKYNKK